MMLQHPGQVSASEVSASAIVPCLSPPGSLVFEDFANLTPFVKEELRFAIQSKHLCHRMSSALESVTISGRPLEMSVTKAEVAPEEDERKKRRRERNKIAAAKCRNKKKEKTECLQKPKQVTGQPNIKGRGRGRSEHLQVIIYRTDTRVTPSYCRTCTRGFQASPLASQRASRSS
uniref:Activating transcription factor 3 n=1 Tax=Balaenoptera musculus TaxID=9771 RepID=A0A8C0CDV9_BALMU